ncbi:MAG: lysine--tRNA ligase [Gammaproteobacteria bacterium]|nr:lysine--tRNA ligase [Gammaproteobacteria bacterium]
MSDKTQRHDLVAERRAKLQALREEGFAYPNDFRPDAAVDAVVSTFGDLDGETLEERGVEMRIAGRMMTRRVMGKASFAHLDDGSGRLQIFVKRDALGDEGYAGFKQLDLGDIVGVEGSLFRTKTGELSLRVSSLRLIAKCLRPLPEKFHGLKDPELRYRRRYLDLIMNPEVRDIFRKRAEMLRVARGLLDAQGFLEVETPMMQPLAGGAVARPFTTHHNALDIALYLRIAPELYLKRLVVGGLQRVYEINRSFRNEGVSTRHNPEFTMLEAYQAWGDCASMMELAECLLQTLVADIAGTSTLEYAENTLNFSADFRRVTLTDAVLEACPELETKDTRNTARLIEVLQARGLEPPPATGWGKLLVALFEHTVEPTLIQPTFVTDYPLEVSPLSRAQDGDAEMVERFELFIGGREIANGFSELNDPEDQARRFEAQLRERAGGDEEAMLFDHDYVRALEYGMPSTGGIGIGMDRVAMLLTGSESIREVLLFPLLRPEPESD